MELKRVPPYLPAALQLRGYAVNLREKKDETRDYTAVVHSQDGDLVNTRRLGHWPDACGLPR